MVMIGSFGDINFLVTDKKIRTFSGFRRESRARWATHEVHLKYPVTEYLGPGQDTISFEMRFDVRYGMKPRTELTRLLRKCREGKAEKLVIGGLPMGAKKWYIESITQTWERVDNKGIVLVGGAQVTLREYV